MNNDRQEEVVILLELFERSGKASKSLTHLSRRIPPGFWTRLSFALAGVTSGALRQKIASWSAWVHDKVLRKKGSVEDSRGEYA